MNLKRSILGASLCCCVVACGSDGGADTDTDTDGATSTASNAGSQGTSPTADDDDSVGGTTASSDSDSESSAQETGEEPTETGEPTTGGEGPVPSLPTADGPCPEFVAGDLDFAPGETGPRRARVFFDPSAGGGGPLVFWFHGTGGSASDSDDALPEDDIAEIMAMGGMLVIPYADPAAGQFPWFLVLGDRQDDLDLMDEIVGCAAAGPGIDPRRIHAAGFSAGGLHTSQAALRRASYVASTVPISGGVYSTGTPSDAPDQVISAMIFHGGASDVAGGLGFQMSSELFQQAVDARGGYTLMCNHGQGHFYLSEREFAWDFMLAHPFGTEPSPFESERPRWVPSFCEG
ncbi:MAG: hypothetical protein KUG77_07760 [Nannocystaceae bacterium]|nr:hypothetical protein [Nannocystaceae bacterium]